VGTRVRTGGWATPIVLTIITPVFSLVVNPGVLLFIPLALMLLALPPRRPMLVALAGFILALGIAGGGGDVLWWFSRGWALILGAWFIAAVALLPKSTFMSRGLLAVFGTAASSLVLFVTRRAGWTQLDWTVANRLRDGAALVAAQWSERLSERAWGAEAIRSIHKAADLEAAIYPALLSLASLAALATVWWLWRRVTEREPNPLGGLREFRFRDELIWVVVVAVLLLVLPLNDDAARTGTNLATFMGALYALRGLAVAIALFGAPGPVGMIFGFAAFLFLFPMVVAATLVLGLSDTWLDLRARVAQAKNQQG